MLFMFLLTSPVLAGPRDGYDEVLAEYQSTLGPKIISYSKNWNTKEKCMQVYKELMKNYVSSEIYKLKYIYLYPDIEAGVNGYYSPDVTLKNGSYAMGDNSYIVILGCDETTSVSNISKTLSHEYGHHFTTYYLVTSEGTYGKGWINSKYAKIRGLSTNNSVINYNSISGSSKWDISEIAANDYVELFGAYSNKTSTDYKDVKERADGGLSSTSLLNYNSNPQANLDIPLATQVSGLYDYWIGLAGGATTKPQAKPMPTLKIQKKYLVQSKYNLYEIVWDSVASGNYEYTIIMHPSSNSANITPIKTTKTGEQNIAYIGSYAGTAKTLIENYSGSYTVRIFCKDQSGFVYEGNKLTINFSEVLTPVSNYSSIFKDLLKNHWAYNYIINLHQAGVINGYGDGTFKPEGTITRQEFIALVMRTSNLNLSKYKQLSNDWFTREGYLAAAKAYGIITTADYGTNYKNLKLTGNISRQEMSVMIGRVLIANGYSISSKTDYTKNFSDSVSSKYKTEINLVIKHGILAGYPDGTFKGSKSASRAEASKMIYKLKKVLG